MSETRPATTVTRKTVDEVFGGAPEGVEGRRHLLDDERLSVRGISRQSVIDTKGDKDAAIALAEARLRAQYRGILTMILVGLAIELAKALILHWLDRGITEPSTVWQPGEPGANEDA